MNINLQAMSDICIPGVRETMTHFIGQTHFRSLWAPSKELKANDSSVPTTLCGGIYRNLGLLLTTQQYATLSEKSFKPTTKPG